MINLRLIKSSDVNLFNNRIKPYNAARSKSGFDDLKGDMDSVFIGKTKKKSSETSTI